MDIVVAPEGQHLQQGGHDAAIVMTVRSAGHPLHPVLVVFSRLSLGNYVFQSFLANRGIDDVLDQTIGLSLGSLRELVQQPRFMSFAWPGHDQDLRPYVQRAHDNGSLVMHMVGNVPEAARAAEAHVDVIVAQGTEGGGHVGWMASMPLVPMVVRAVAPIPVIAAGGIADGRGLAAALALGADGVLLGTRFLATTESPLHPNFKQAIVNSDGQDTTLSEIPDIASRTMWPGAMSRTLRNRFN